MRLKAFGKLATLCSLLVLSACPVPRLVIAFQYTVKGNPPLKLSDLDSRTLSKEENPAIGDFLRESKKCLVRTPKTGDYEALFGICLVGQKIWVFHEYVKESKETVGFKDKNLSKYLWNPDKTFASDRAKEHVEVAKSIERLLKRKGIPYSSDGLVELRYEHWKQFKE